MINLEFPDGAVRHYEPQVTPLAIAEGISKSLAKKVVAAKVDGQWWDLSRPLDHGGKFELVTRDSADGLEVLRHDLPTRGVRDLPSRRERTAHDARSAQVEVLEVDALGDA